MTTLGQESGHPTQRGDEGAARDKLQKFPSALSLCDIHNAAEIRLMYFDCAQLYLVRMTIEQELL
jgi:hypothetical protein